MFFEIAGVSGCSLTVSLFHLFFFFLVYSLLNLSNISTQCKDTQGKNAQCKTSENPLVQKIQAYYFYKIRLDNEMIMSILLSPTTIILKLNMKSTPIKTVAWNIKPKCYDSGNI